MSILLSSDNESSSSSDEHIQLIEYQMCCLKKKIAKLRKKTKAILMKKKIKSSRKSQKIKSNILQSGMKSSTKENSSSIQWNTWTVRSPQKYHVLISNNIYYQYCVVIIL